MLIAQGRLSVAITAEKWLDAALGIEGVELLPLTPKIAVESISLPGDFHKDPADRIIVATARIHGISLVTEDRAIRSYEHVTTLP
jgi:PIN domain nuclease of toxin-antitoxin system